MTSSRYPERVTVHRIVGQVAATCDLGEAHTRDVYATKALTFTGELRIAPPGGYSDSARENPVYQDAQGRTYNTYSPVDYHGSTRYVDEEGHSFGTRVPRDAVRIDEVDAGRWSPTT